LSKTAITPEASRPIHDALRESLKGIDISFQPVSTTFRKDKVQTANSREISVKTFLESFFPSGWSVKKGPIFDKEGNSSGEVDCALCVSEHPPCLTPNRQLIFAEGVHAAVEVKPDLTSLGDKTEFRRALDQCCSVKRLKRAIFFPSTTIQASWPIDVHKIPYVIFAKQIPEFVPAIRFMDSYKAYNAKSPWDLPDIILGYDTGLIYHAPDVSICSLTPFFKKNEITSGEAYLTCPMGSDAIILFLSLLYGFIFPRPLISAPILKELLWPIMIPAGMELFQDR
jgi:hypothetical protein